MRIVHSTKDPKNPGLLALNIFFDASYNGGYESEFIESL